MFREDHNPGAPPHLEFDSSHHDTLSPQAAQTVVTLALIRVLTKGPLEDEQTDPAVRADLFKYSVSEPFTSPRGWLVWAGVGVALSPLVVGVVTGLLSLVE